MRCKACNDEFDPVEDEELCTSCYFGDDYDPIHTPIDFSDAEMDFNEDDLHE